MLYEVIKAKSRKYYSQTVIPNMAKMIKNDIKSTLGESFFAITSDGWSQPTKSPNLQRLIIFKEISFLV